eukprot:754113-Hanusia_phi.AAC.3
MRGDRSSDGEGGGAGSRYIAGEETGKRAGEQELRKDGRGALKQNGEGAEEEREGREGAEEERERREGAGEERERASNDERRLKPVRQPRGERNEGV